MALKKDSILANASGVELPSLVSMSVGEEIVWSKNAGRTSNARMVGTVIAEKKTVSLAWGVLNESEIRQIEEEIPKGFTKMYILGTLYEVYRGTLTKEVLGYIGDGILYYKSASTDIIQR